MRLNFYLFLYAIDALKQPSKCTNSSAINQGQQGFVLNYQSITIQPNTNHQTLVV